MNRLLLYLRVILKWRKLIFYNTLILTVLAVGISFILPQRFTAVAQLLPPPEDDIFGMSSILGGGLGSASRLSRMRLGGMLGGSTSSDLMVGILESRSVMQKVVERCSIIQYYRIKKNSMDGALKTLAKITAFKVTDEGIVRISVEAKTRGLAAKTANTYVEELNHFLCHSNVTRGKATRIFVERRVREVDSSLAVAEESLRSFQELHRVVSVEEETKAVVDVYAKLKSRLLVKRAELGMVEGVSSADNPYVVTLRAENAALEEQLRRVEQGGDKDGFGVGFGVSFGDLPAVAGEYLRRYRDFKVLQEAYGLMYQQLEYAKVMEARDTPAITVLDYAVPPEKHSFPRRWIIVLATSLFSLAAGVALVFVSEYFDHIRDARPEEYKGWHEVRGQFVTVLRRVRRFFTREKN